MQRSEDRCDKRRFRGFNHSTCETVLNQLRKIVVVRVTVVKFRVDNRGSDGTIDGWSDGNNLFHRSS